MRLGVVSFRVGLHRHLLWVRPYECRDPDDFNPRCLVLGKAAPVSATTTARVDFPTQIKPMLEAKCQPCHFSGGKVYAKMPFDRPETIKTMGTKLFTRIKDENERQLIRDFLAQD